MFRGSTAACPTGMELSFVCIHHGAAVQAVTLFCILWPFATLAFLRSRQTSTAPVLAVLLPIAVAECGSWIVLADVVGAMALARRSPMATAAGSAEALCILSVAAFSAALIAVFALVRRHRPVMDRFSAVLAAVLLIEIVAAMIFAARLAPSKSLILFALVSAGAVFLIALAIAVRIIAVLRGRIRSRAIPYAVAVAVVLYIVTAVVVYREIERYVDIAQHGVLSTWY